MKKINKADFNFSEILCELECEDIYDTYHDDLVQIFKDFDSKSLLPEYGDFISVQKKNGEKEVWQVCGVDYGYTELEDGELRKDEIIVMLGRV